MLMACPALALSSSWPNPTSPTLTFWDISGDLFSLTAGDVQLVKQLVPFG